LIKGLKKSLREYKKRVVFVLSVDLAHMGPKFGDAEGITETKAQAIKEADYKMFDVVNRLDSGQYYELMKKDLLPRRVDACAAIYTLLSIMEKGEGKTVGYGQNFQPDTQSLVSYGSMVFYEK
jgi:AmmeMemoRadiSam system protein B